MHFFRKILRELNISHTTSYAEALVEERADSYTLFGVKKMLESYAVKLTAVRVANKDVAQLDYPCIVLYDQYPTLLKSAPENIDNFKQQWDGVALIVDKSDSAREPHYYVNLFRSQLTVSLPYVVALSLVWLVVMLLHTTEFTDVWYKLLLLLLNGAGAFFSWRTVQGECSSSCHSVLESPASKLFGLYSLGVIGLAYFVSNILIYLAIPAFEPTVSIVCIVALIMPLWSVSYQKFVAKAWCKNCLKVQLVLVLASLAVILFHGIGISQLQVGPALGVLALYIVVFYLCQYVYQLLQRIKAVPQTLIYSYKSLMQDSVVRQRILESGDKYDTQGASQLIIHQPVKDTEKEMLVMLSPYCSHCSTLFLKVRELLAAGKLKEYKVTLLFSPSPQGLPSYGSIICEYQQHGADAAIQLLANWYDSPKLKKFQKKFDAYVKDDNFFAEVKRQEEWCDKQNFTVVPVLLINSRVVDHTLIEGIVS